MTNNEQPMSYVVFDDNEGECRVIAASSSKDEADKLARKLAAGNPYDNKYRVSAIPVNEEIPDGYTDGFSASYSYIKHGWVVDKANILTEEALYFWRAGGVVMHHDNQIVVMHETKRKCVKALIDYAAKRARQ